MKFGNFLLILKIAFIFPFENSAEVTEKIFISGGSFKHRKTRSNETEDLNKNNNNLNNNGSILFSGWVKYFKYRENDISVSNTPKTFIDNSEFNEQIKLFPNADLNEKDKDGKYKFIRDKSMFWINVFVDSINVISSKMVNFF